MKIAPLYHALKEETWISPEIVHTGQHYDTVMSNIFFEELRLPAPDFHLGVGSGTHAEQTGKVMIEYEKVLRVNAPDLVVVVGDVNSTMAATLVAVKAGIPVAHLEAGLRSFDRTMPEEINRLVTDALADYLWTPSPDGDENLIREGVAQEKITRVGNIMIDSLEMMRERIEASSILTEIGLDRGAYGLVTLHRPSNVDDRSCLEELCNTLVRIAKKIPLVFPIHPRTRKNLKAYGLTDIFKDVQGLYILDPLPYVEFMNLVFHCRFIITDSGGIQEETTYLGIPCLTMRLNTERPVTIHQGTNKLVTPDKLESEADDILSGKQAKHVVPELWDGRTAQRIVRFLADRFC